MKKLNRIAAGYLACCTIATAMLGGIPASPAQLEAWAHQGRTDSSGGHKDNKNKSGLGSYHYHCGGHPAHLHDNGGCPYSSAPSQTQAAKPAPSQPAETKHHDTGWNHDSCGWWYKTSGTDYCKDGFSTIDGNTYYFNSDGYMLIGWQNLGEKWYYFNTDGHMVTGFVYIDSVLYEFGSDGVWIE